MKSLCVPIVILTTPFNFPKMDGDHPTDPDEEGNHDVFAADLNC